MEKIQSAIAKARARRQASGAGVARLSPPGVDAAWSALKETRLVTRDLRRNRIFADHGCAESTPFDMLRTRMLRQMRAEKWRRVAITSPHPGCGKSTVAANLALSFARQPDIRTVLCEIDMRHPSLSRLLGVWAPPQFSRVLAGEETPEDHLLRVGENLALALNAEPVSGASEMLQAPSLPQTLDRIERLLAPSVVLFDLPPMLRSDDAMAFLDKVDCALLVAEADVTTIDDIDRCERELAEQTNVLGVVLNKLRHHEANGYGYGD